MEVLSQSKPSLTTKEETSNLALCIIKVDYDYHRLQSYLLVFGIFWNWSTQQGKLIGSVY